MRIRNVIANCIIDNCYYGIDATSMGVASEAGNNLISNCSFYLSRYVIRANRSCDSLRFVGNIFQGSSGLGYGGGWYTGTNTGDIIPNGSTAYFKDCDYYNIEGGMPTNFVTNTVGGDLVILYSPTRQEEIFFAIFFTVHRCV